MSLWSAKEAVAATGGKAQGDWVATGVSIDTRTLQKGDLFVALRDVRDGHEFVNQALELGASAALVGHIPEGVDNDAPLLIVPDVLTALEALGRAARARTNARVVAVTGSVGKTSTKEMLREVLMRQGRTHAAEASYNNHWGVPLTLARMPADTEFAVIELGMSNPGEIAPLAQMARPHVAMITTVAAAHLEAFEDGLEGIAREKSAIFSGLEAGGTAVINADVETAPILRAAGEKAAETVLDFGENARAYKLLNVTLAQDTTVVEAEAHGAALLFKVSSAGRHFAMNGLGVLAAVEALGADVAVAAADLPHWLPPAGRGTRERVVLDPAHKDMVIELIDDAFNANPTSMLAALEGLAASPLPNIEKPQKPARRIAVLGDMLELGPDEKKMHAKLAKSEFVERLDVVHCAGPLMRKMWKKLPSHLRGEWAETADELAERMPALLRAGDVVLVKGSKGSYISHVVDALRKLGHGPK